MLSALSIDIIKMVAKKIIAAAIPERFLKSDEEDAFLLAFFSFDVVYLLDNGSNFHVASDSEMDVMNA